MTPTLDYRGYPHILDRVFHFSSAQSLLTLRTACTSFRDKADILLAQHLVVHDESPQSRNAVISPFGLQGWHPHLMALKPFIARVPRPTISGTGTAEVLYRQYYELHHNDSSYLRAVVTLKHCRILDVVGGDGQISGEVLRKAFGSHMVEVVRGRRRNVALSDDDKDEGPSWSFHIESRCIVHLPRGRVQYPELSWFSYAGNEYRPFKAVHNLTVRELAQGGLWRVKEGDVWNDELVLLFQPMNEVINDSLEVTISDPIWLAFRRMFRGARVPTHPHAAFPIHVIIVNVLALPANCFKGDDLVQAPGSDIHPFEYHLRRIFAETRAGESGCQLTFLTTEEYIERVGAIQYDIETEVV